MANPANPVRIEVRLPGSRPSFHEVTSAEFLLGSVSGCDLVIPGDDLPPVLGVIARTAEGVRLRKLAPNLKLTVNGKAIHHAPLTNGDSIGIGTAQLIVHVPAAAAVQAPVAAAAAASKPWNYTIPLTGEPAAEMPYDSLRQMQQEAERLKQQSREVTARQRALDAEEQSRRQTWAEREAQLEAEVETARERGRTARNAVGRGEIDQRVRELEAREKKLTAELKAFEASVHNHREDLARVDRYRADAEAHEREAQARLQEIDQRAQKLQRDTLLVDEKTRLVGEADAKVRADQERVQQLHAEAEAARNQAALKLSEVEQREKSLKTLEAGLHRLRADLDLQEKTVSEQKSLQEARERDLTARQQGLDTRLSELDATSAAQAKERNELDERQTALQGAAAQLKSLQERLTAQETACRGQDADLKNREEKLSADGLALEKSIAVHREELARLDRLRETLEAREKAVADRSIEIDERYVKLGLDAQSHQEQAQRIAEAEAKLQEEQERIRQLQAEYEANTTQLAERATTSEGQQAILAMLRSKMERMREELRTESQSLTEQRTRQEVLERELAEKQKQLNQAKTELEAEQQAREQEKREFEERTATMQTAVTQLKALQERLAEDEESVVAHANQIDAKSKEHAEKADVLRNQAAQLLEMHQKLEAEREAMREREQKFAEAEEARRELQEQLIKRSQELDLRRRAGEEQTAEYERRAAELAGRAAELERDRRLVDSDLSTNRHDLDSKAAELEQLGEELVTREQQLNQRIERLKEVGQTLAAERKTRFEAKAAWEEEHRLAAEDLARTRAELESYREQALAQAAQMQQVLPELELRGAGALERLAQAREQLKSHVAELHEYARQSHDDLEALRNQVQSETERLREQQATMSRVRSEHRLAVTDFRQQLIDWQGRVAEMKQTIARDGTRLERKQSELDTAAREIDSTAQQLARQAAQLQAQEQQVARQRGEVQYHLTDMRDWFRRKLKELAENSSIRIDDTSIQPGSVTGIVLDHASPAADNEQILAITSDLDPGDCKLGELLQSLDLVDDTTLTALLLEARRQRRSLRQVLLASGKLTVYQMALIEAGNVDGLTIGPLGVIDRLRVTPQESVYRVIDPRPGNLTGPLVLRHLAEGQMQDPVRADEFRQRFAALADLRHPHVAATIEVLEINDRPAALQEWLTGLSGTEWPTLAASPGVWYRLTCQALLGLATAHHWGLVHGGISAHSLVLTPDGLVKLTGVGEPAWLNGVDPAKTADDDLRALGHVAAGWAALMPKRKGAKPPRPLPTAVREVLDRWVDGGYESAAAVLDDLDRAGTDVPAGVETWERLVKYAGENGADGVAWRKSA